LDIIYKVDEEPEQTFNWSGNVLYSESSVIELPLLEMSGLNSGTFTASLANPNGQIDEYVFNNILSSEIASAENVSSPVTLVLKLDDYPEQTSWEVLNSNGSILYSGGDYTDPNVFVTEAFDLIDTDCYTFKIYDSEGNGLAGTGLYKLMYGTTVFRQGKQYGYMDEVQFGIGLTDVQEEVLEASISVYPNPASNKVYINTMAEGNLEIMDSKGQVVLNQLISQGTLQIDISDLSSGLYYVRYKGKYGIEVCKIVIKNN